MLLGGCTAVTLSEQFHHHEGRALRGEGTTVSFDQLGHENTADTLRLARARAEQVGIRDIVVASITGATGIKACEFFPGYNVLVVAGAVGYPEPNACRMPPEHRATLEAYGAKVLFAGHAFGMLGRAVHRKFGAIQLDEVIAHALRVVGAGVKVACEVVCMATDAGLIRAGQSEEVPEHPAAGKGMLEMQLVKLPHQQGEQYP